jgi:hypothetical protein
MAVQLRNAKQWSHVLRREYSAYTTRATDDARKGRQYPRMADLVIQEMARRLTPWHAATALGISLTEVESALARPGLR